jgi:hypothetical protein
LLRIRHQLAREGAKVGHLARILGRHRESEVIPPSPHRSVNALVSAASEVASNIRASAPLRVTPSRLR